MSVVEEIKQKSYAEKLEFLNKLRNKMHPIGHILLDGFRDALNKGFELKKHDKQWIDDMLDAVVRK